MSLRRTPLARKTELQRGTSELKRGNGPERRTRVKAFNAARKKRRKDAGEVYGPYYERIANRGTCLGQRALLGHRCITYADRRPEAHHVKHVGSGGKDAANLVDCCHGMHDWLHATGPSAAAEYLGFTLQAEAERLWLLDQEDVR